MINRCPSTCCQARASQGKHITFRKLCMKNNELLPFRTRLSSDIGTETNLGNSHEDSSVVYSLENDEVKLMIGAPN